MRNLTSQAELLACFREIDRDEVELAPELAFPLELDGALAWIVGPRAFLVFRERENLRGIVFHRGSGALPDVAAMCEWCHAVRGHGGVNLMSVRASERRRVGLYLCSDLSCVDRTRPPGTDDLREGFNGDERARRAIARISEFAARRLF